MSNPHKRLPQRIGYARVSTLDQDPEHQIKALEEAGCDAIYADRVSGVRRQRPQLDKVLEHLQADDTLVVWKLDRLGRSLQHLIEIVNSLEERKVQLQSLTQGINTRTASGRMIFGDHGGAGGIRAGADLGADQTGCPAPKREEREMGPSIDLSQCRDGPDREDIASEPEPDEGGDRPGAWDQSSLPLQVVPGWRSKAVRRGSGSTPDSEERINLRRCRCRGVDRCRGCEIPGTTRSQTPGKRSTGQFWACLFKGSGLKSRVWPQGGILRDRRSLLLWDWFWWGKALSMEEPQ